MRLCIVGKYPPIQGGVSRETFWETRALAQSGHVVHVVTNAGEADDAYRTNEEFYSDQPGDDPRSSPGPHVHLTPPGAGEYGYIPYANPYVSKLAGLAAQVTEDESCDLIYGYYLEPYGVAAHLASQWTGATYGLRHAGSDITHLYRVPGLRTTYQNIMRDASFWRAPESTRRGIQHLGVDIDRFYPSPGFSLPTDYFHPDVAPMRFAELDERASGQEGEGTAPGSRFDPSVPTVGIYGKLGPTKGSFELLAALSVARRRAGRCNLVVASNGPPFMVDQLRRTVEELGLADCVLLLPFMPHWKIPAFIAGCDAVAFLERDFPVPGHTPLVPREVLACGACLLVSRDIASAPSSYARRLADRENCLIADPRDVGELAGALCLVISDRTAAQEIGRVGLEKVSRQVEDWPTYVGNVSKTFEQIYDDLGERRTTMTMVETQAALARLYVDEAFLKWFELAPDSAMSKYLLTPEEKAAIQSIDRKLLRMFASSLRVKRSSLIERRFPLSSKVCGEHFDRYLDRYIELHPATPNAPLLDQIVSFSEYLVACLYGDSAVPVYAADLSRYEGAMNDLRIIPLDSDELPPSVEEQGENNAEPDPSARPVIRPTVRPLRLDYDIPAVVERIEQDETELDVQPARTNLVLLRRRGQRTTDAFTVNEPVMRLLDLCTGDGTVAEIKKELAAELGLDVAGIDDAVDAMLLRLRADDVVSVE